MNLRLDKNPCTYKKFQVLKDLEKRKFKINHISSKHFFGIHKQILSLKLLIRPELAGLGPTPN